MAKAREIIEELQKLDPEEEIYTSNCCYGTQESDIPRLDDKYIIGPGGVPDRKQVWVIE